MQRHSLLFPKQGQLKMQISISSTHRALKLRFRSARRMWSHLLDGAQSGELAMAHVEELSQMRDCSCRFTSLSAVRPFLDLGALRPGIAQSGSPVITHCLQTSDHPISPAPAVIVHVSQAQPHGVETMPLSRVGGSQSVASGFQYAYSEHKTAKSRLEF
ncbi:hypothetical protein CIHG_00264 [Coccidioides immitis H538.4]|uniref:Uncharacterized protein n=1 Tax=Coccidioides immitis H538.4 TaxID=396776 RepID=A0A0J8RC54_COCIT|nr:hypothetical protein CIHG_00264 [Coccidioides immitis H538.4]